MKKTGMLLSPFFILFHSLYSMQNYECKAYEHYESLAEKNGTCVHDMKSVVDNLGSLYFHLNEYCLQPDHDHTKKSALEAVQVAKTSFSTIANTIALLGQSNVPVTDSKLYNWFHQREVPIMHHLKKACAYISKKFDKIESEITTQNFAQEKIARLYDHLYGNIDSLFLIFNGSIGNNEIANKIKDQKFYQRCFYGVREWELVTGNYAKKLGLEQIRTRAHLYKDFAERARTKVACAKKIAQKVNELANKPDLSGLALLFLNPSFAVKKALTYGIEPLLSNYPTLSAPLIRAVPLLGDVKNAMDENMAPSSLMEKAHTAIPDPLKPPLIFVLQHFGKIIINPFVWFCSKGADCVIDTTEKFVDTILDEAKKPLLEDQLFPYLTQLGLCYQDLSQELYNSIEAADKVFEQQILHKTSLKTIMSEQQRAQEEYKAVKAASKTNKLMVANLSHLIREKLIRLAERRCQIMNIDAAQCESQRAQEVLQQYQNHYENQKNKIKELICKKEELEKEIEQALNKLENIKVWFKWFDRFIEQKHQEKRQLDEFRNVSPLIFFQELFKEQVLSDEQYAYYEELVIINSHEFRALVKKYYKSLHKDSLTIQELFNTWFELMLEREHMPYKKVIEGNLNVIHGINESIAHYQAELDENKNKKYRITRILLWFYHLVKSDPLQEKKQSLYTHQDLLKTCQRYHVLVQQAAPYKFVTVQKGYAASDDHKRMVHDLLQKVSLKNKVQMKPILEVEIPLHEMKEEIEEDIQIYTKEVSQQNGDAECGYHALYNALKSIGGFTHIINLESFIEQCKKRVVLYRNENNQAWQLPDAPKYFIKREYEKCKPNSAQWICEDEITGILERYKSQKKDIKITFIPDIQKYLNLENQGLDKEIISDVAQAQRAIKDLSDYERVYILGTAQEQDSYTNKEYNGYRGHGHWIAIKQTIKNHQVIYEVMNSMQSYDCKMLVQNLIDLLHTDNIFLPVSDKQSEELTKLVTNLEFSKVFRDGCYALNPVSKGSDSCEVVGYLPADLLDRIINSATQLLVSTEGKSFGNCMGYRNPLEIVLKIINDIETCLGQGIVLKNYSNDRSGFRYTMELSEEQKSSLNKLKIWAGYGN